jgi:hypothetical protein
MAVEAVVCPACGASNRSATTRCAVCGEALADEWPSADGAESGADPARAPSADSQLRRRGQYTVYPRQRAGSRPDDQAPRGRVVGIARDVKLRTESAGVGGRRTEQILSFRVDRFDPEGRKLLSTAVEMRGRSLHGVLNEGDSVDVGRPKRGALHPRRIRNQSTNSVVRVRRRSWLRRFFVFLLVVAVAVVVLETVAHSAIGGPALPSWWPHR